MEFKEIENAIKQRKISPVYFFHGEEPYFIDKLTELVENEILAPAERSFNQTVLYGKDIKEVQQILDAAMRYPMMSERQVIVVREAQDLDFLKRGSDAALQRLQKYVDAPLSTTVLCFAHKHKKLDGRSGFAKALAKKAVMFESKPLYENKVPEFIRTWLKENHLSIEGDALDLLVEYLGTDLSKIINELEKLQLNIEKGGKITTELIEKYVGISREYNVFELQKALANRDIFKANRITNYFVANPKEAPMPMLVATLYGFFSKLFAFTSVSQLKNDQQISALGLRNEWQLRDYQAAAKVFPKPKIEAILDTLQVYDLRSKGVNNDSTPEGALLTELVYKILH